MRLMILAALAALFALASAVPAVAKAIPKPVAYSLICLQAKYKPNSQEARYICSNEGPSRVRASDEHLTAIEKVNHQVHRSMRQQSDPAGKDIWTLDARAGDCEDFAITKRKRLIQMGFPSNALPLRWGQLRNGQYHVVLTVRTDKGIFVLDNLHREVRRLEDTPYRKWGELS